MNAGFSDPLATEKDPPDKNEEEFDPFDEDFDVNPCTTDPTNPLFNDTDPLCEKAFNPATRRRMRSL